MLTSPMWDIMEENGGQEGLMWRETEDILQVIRRVQIEAERHFYDLVASWHRSAPGEAAWRPLADVFETERAVMIRLELAGVPREEITVTLDGRLLTVSGTRRDEFEGGERIYHQAEIAYGRFERRFTLPWEAAEEDIRAVYRNGFLTLTIHKPSPEGKRVKVEVKGEK